MEKLTSTGPHTNSQQVADTLEPGGDSLAVVTQLTGTIHGSPTWSEGNASI